MAIKLKQGEDLLLELVVLDEDNNKVDLTTANKIRVSFDVKNLVVYKYLDQTREAAIAGYGDVEVNATNNYQLDIRVLRNQSATFPIGNISATVLIDFPDAILTNRRYEYTYAIGTVEKGILKSEDLTI